MKVTSSLRLTSALLTVDQFELAIPHVRPFLGERVTTAYDIAPPAGWTQSQFDNSAAQEGSSYSQGQYSLTGPNSNTAAATIIYDGGHANVNIPDVPGAVAEYYNIAPPWPMGR